MEKALVASRTRRGGGWTIPIFLMSLYLFVEYATPEFLRPFHPVVVLMICIAFFLVREGLAVKTILTDWYIRLFLLFLGEMLILGFMAVNNYWAFMSFKEMVTIFMFSLAFCVFLDDVRKLFLILSAFLLVLGLDALAMVGGFRNIVAGTSFMGDTNDFAMVMNIGIPIAFYMGISRKGILRIAFWGICMLLVLANVAAFSRGGFIGMTATGIFCWYQSKRKVRSTILFLLVVTVFFFSISPRYKTELYSIVSEVEGTEQGTGKGRIELWKVAWNAFRKNPVLGVGQGNLPLVLGEYASYDDGSYWKRYISGTAVHSAYMTVLAEFGIVGTFLWIAMLFNIVSKYRFVRRAEIGIRKIPDSDGEATLLIHAVTGLFGGMIGYLVSAVFLSSFSYPHFWYLSALITAGYVLMQKRVLPPEESVAPG